MPRVGVVANDADYARWIQSDVYEMLMDIPRDDGDTATEVVQIRPGQALTGIGFRLLIVVTWPDHSDDPVEAMRWLHEEVAVRLEEGGLLMYEAAVEEGPQFVEGGLCHCGAVFIWCDCADAGPEGRHLICLGSGEDAGQCDRLPEPAGDSADG